MRVGIDISQVVYGTGVSVYTEKLVSNLLLVDSEVKYILFAGILRRYRQLRSFTNSLKGNFENKYYFLPPKILNVLWNDLHILNVEKLIGKVDIFHSSDWTQPPSNALKVTTVHDLIPILYPGQSDPYLVKIAGKRFNWVKKEADRIIVPTKTTKSDLVKKGVNEKKIRVISEAPVYSKVSQEKTDKVRTKYAITGKYFLSVGLSPRKNTDNIIKAYKGLKNSKDISLVIVGHGIVKSDNVDGVKTLGHVDSEDIASLYSGAEVLVYPSFYEGFGLPIIEAFSCGIPVVTSNTGSMKEISGNAAVLVDPLSVNSIKNGIINAMDNRKEYIGKGSEAVKQYSWEKTASHTLQVYKELL